MNEYEWTWMNKEWTKTMNKEWTWCIESPLLSVPNQSWSSYLAAKAQQDEEAASERSKRCEWLGKQLAKRKQEILGQTFTYFLHTFYMLNTDWSVFPQQQRLLGFNLWVSVVHHGCKALRNLNGTLEPVTQCNIWLSQQVQYIPPACNTVWRHIKSQDQVKGHFRIF